MKRKMKLLINISCLIICIGLSVVWADPLFDEGWVYTVSNLLPYYSIDEECSSFVRDESSYENHGTNYGIEWTSEGVNGSALMDRMIILQHRLPIRLGMEISQYPAGLDPGKKTGGKRAVSESLV